MAAVTISSIIDDELNRLLEIEAQNAEMTKSAYIKKMIKEKLKTGTQPAITEKSSSVPVITEKPINVTESPAIEKPEEKPIGENREEETKEEQSGLMTISKHDIGKILDYFDKGIKNVDDKITILENKIRNIDMESIKIDTTSLTTDIAETKGAVKKLKGDIGTMEKNITILYNFCQKVAKGEI